MKAAARAVVAAGLTGYILWRSHPRDVLAAMAGADWRPIAIAVALVLVDRTLMACRWLLLLCIIDRADRPPLAETMRIFFVSTFVGTFLPASIGADAVRAYGMTRLNVRGRDAVASVFMDRMLGVASILVMAAVGLMLARDLAGNRPIVLALIVAGGACAATLLVVFTDAAAALAARAIRVLPARLHGFAEGLVGSIRRYSTHHGQLGNVLLGSIAVQTLRIVQAYFLGTGLGIAAPAAAYFAFVPLILLVMLLPVTFNGIGTSQAAFVWFFGRAGVTAPAAFALSVLFVALGVVGNLPGGLLYALGDRGMRPKHV
ncbi:MAG TPA: lysylphosphatidylglycerol synthase transmembrane domain-containing protein [Vicinamibacterales bacterium]|nr:lysylphosphatidylglycerol synthase transmembrane domain-containing protein [Vicinamibacterales bacterium]